MAISSIGHVTQGTSTTNNTTLTRGSNPIAAVPVNDVVIVTIAADNSSSSDGDNAEVSSVTDSVGNTYSKLGEYTNANGGAGNGVTVSVWASRITSAIIEDTTGVTVTFAASITHKCFSMWRFSASNALSIDAGPITSQVDADNGFGSSTISGLSSASRLYFRGLAKESNSTTALTATTSFSTITGLRSGTATDAVLVRGEFRINTSTGETSNPTMDVSADSAGVFLALTDDSTPPPPENPISINLNDPIGMLGIFGI